MKFCRDEDQKVMFYDSNNYDSIEEAEAVGATYVVGSCVSLYGVGGLQDIKEIVDTAMDCIGHTGIITNILLEDGYHNIKDIIEEHFDD